MRFSIITVCKNNILGLKSTYNSIKDQWFKDFEWIVIDGNSTDGTVDFMNSLEHDWTHFYSEPDAGIYDAMNKGIRRSKGDFMVFMNSGDRLYSNETLQIVTQSIERYKNIRLIYGDSIDIDFNGNEYYRNARNVRQLVYGMIAQHQSFYFSRKIEDGIQFYSLQYNYSSDYDFIIRYIKKVKENFIKLDFPLSIYLLGGINEKRRLAAIKEDYSIRKEQLGVGIIQNMAIFVAHLVHKAMKVSFPRIMRRYRYRK